MLRGIAAAAALIGSMLAAEQATAAGPGDVHAHRGGGYVHGVPAYGENTLPAFAASAAKGFVLELDVVVTADDVPVVIHDATLDRTTSCSGPVASRTAAQLRAACRSDVLGSPGSGLPSAPDPTPEVVPTLAEVLAFAKSAGARLNLEIKNIPTESDFDPTTRFATSVVDVIAASGFPRSRLIVQSFWPPNLDIARLRLPGIQTSILTLKQMNVLGPIGAGLLRHDWVSPAHPTSKGFATIAHALGRKVVPYTLNSPGAVGVARSFGADAYISDDPSMALAALTS